MSVNLFQEMKTLVWITLLVMKCHFFMLRLWSMIVVCGESLSNLWEVGYGHWRHLVLVDTQWGFIMEAASVCTILLVSIKKI